MKFLEWAFIYKKHDTLRYVMFLHTKSITLYKKQDNLRCVYIYIYLDTSRYVVFIGFLKLAEGVGGVGVICKKNCTLNYIFIYKKQYTLRYVYIYKNPETLCYIFICKKQCTLRFFCTSKIYRIVPKTNYKRMYDKRDQIKKLIRDIYQELVLFLKEIHDFLYIPENESVGGIMGWTKSTEAINTMQMTGTAVTYTMSLN